MNRLLYLQNKITDECRKTFMPFSNKIIVHGSGNCSAEILLIGEASGGEEERLQKPFVGKAGKNLNFFLETIGIEREDIYITNVVKFRPTRLSAKTNNLINRTPNKEEIEFFKVFLKEEIEIVNPRYVVTLGNVALNAIVEKKCRIGDFHGQLIATGKYNVYPLYHPASIIYNRALSDIYLQDLINFKELL